MQQALMTSESERTDAPSLSVHSSPPALGLGSAGRWRLCGGSPATVDRTTRWHRPPRSREFAVLEKNQTLSLVIFVKAFLPFPQLWSKETLIILKDYIFGILTNISRAKKSFLCGSKSFVLNYCSRPIIKINQKYTSYSSNSLGR